MIYSDEVNNERSFTNQCKKYFVSQDVPKQLKNTSMLYKSFRDKTGMESFISLIYLKEKFTRLYWFSKTF